MSSAPSPASIQQRPLEDPLAHLPCSTILEYKKGQTIYDRISLPAVSILSLVGR